MTILLVYTALFFGISYAVFLRRDVTGVAGRSRENLITARKSGPAGVRTALTCRP